MDGIVNEVQIFDFQANEVRVVIQDGEPWFIAKDVCSVLQHTNHRAAIAGLDTDEKGVSIVDTHGGRQSMSIISEAGLYALIFSSRLEKAKAFRRWVTHDVLPNIRRTGTYSIAPKTSAEILLETVQQLVENERRTIQLENEMRTMQRRMDLIDQVDINGDEQQQLNKLIRKYAQENGLTFAKGWRDFTDRFNTAYDTNLALRMRNYQEKHGLSGLTRPQYLSLVGQLPDALRVVDKMLNPVPTGV